MSASISAGLGSRAAPITTEWRGRTLTFKYLEFATTISALENWLADRALKFKSIGWDLLLSKGVWKADDYAKATMDFVNDCNENGTYSFGSEPMMKILSSANEGQVKVGDIPKGTFEGIVKLSSLLLGLSEDDTISLMSDSEKSREVGIKLAMVMGRSQPSPGDIGASESVSEPVTVSA